MLETPWPNWHYSATTMQIVIALQLGMRKLKNHFYQGLKPIRFEINNPNYLFHKNRTSQLKREWLNEITHQVKDGWISGLVNFNKRLVVDYNKHMITTIIFLGSPIQLLSYFFWRLNWNLIQRCYLTSFNVLLWPLFWQKQRSEQNIAG